MFVLRPSAFQAVLALLALGETDHFLLLQAPEGTFVEVIGPLER
jgi:hypothetical protein